MCAFQSLYYSDDGYVVQCKDCGHYQLGFGTMMLSLSRNDFTTLRKIVKCKYQETNIACTENARNIVIPTPSQSSCLLLTREESDRFHEILEAADTEEKAQEMIALFYQ